MKIQKLAIDGILAGLIAGVINVIIYFVAKSMGGISDAVLLPGGDPLMLVPVILSSVLPGLLAGLLLFGIFKFFSNPVRIFSITACIFLVVSMAGPLVTPGLPTGMRITLSLMHLAAGSVIIFYLTRGSGK